ncbi:MAG: Gfo/Idh/MocA family oxidoreductase [Deltaproteobacteria bacterium]
MRVIIVGLGIQGNKRKCIAGSDVVATVDPIAAGADYKSVEAVPAATYDAALLCIPDEPKIQIINYLVECGKHVLVEKPLVAEDQGELEKLADLINRKNAVCYTAYNHRFEPHFVRLKETIESGVLGKLYRLRFFYGNGTARDVRNSPWRDKGGGVLHDLASHLLDTLLFVLGSIPKDLRIWSANCFENNAFDHIICGATAPVLIEFEMSLLSWRNHFVAEVYGENGSAHIESLCKWGPSTFTLRKRVLPSGRPPEESITLVKADPTWELEYGYFNNLCETGGMSNIGNDLIINLHLKNLYREAIAKEQ